MKAAVMQPYFLPYIGYFQLIHAVDVFVVYDNIEYTKKGWINRNRMLKTGKDEYFSLPLKNDSDYLHINRRRLAEGWPREAGRLLNRIRETYRKAPFFTEGYALAEEIITYPDPGLFGFIHHSLQKVCGYLDIRTRFVVSSTLDIDHTLKSEAKVLAICQALQADVYINPIGGTELYSAGRFGQQGIELLFLRPVPFVYAQFSSDFAPWLSILDVIMFNGREQVRHFLNDTYRLVKN